MIAVSSGDVGAKHSLRLPSMLGESERGRKGAETAAHPSIKVYRTHKEPIALYCKVEEYFCGCCGRVFVCQERSRARRGKQVVADRRLPFFTVSKIQAKHSLDPKYLVVVLVW